MRTCDMDGQMKDTKMSDSPSTGVAMRFNSQHQSDKLPDKVVQPWRCHDGRQRQADIRVGFDKANRAFLACWDLTPSLFYFDTTLVSLFLKEKNKLFIFFLSKTNKQVQSDTSPKKITLRIKYRKETGLHVNFYLLKPVYTVAKMNR